MTELDGTLSSISAQLQRPCALCYTKCFLTDRIVYFSLPQNGSLLLLKEKALTFFNLGSLGRFETEIKPTFIKLRNSKFTNSALKPSIFPSFDLQLSRTSSRTRRRDLAEVRPPSEGCRKLLQFARRTRGKERLFLKGPPSVAGESWPRSTACSTCRGGGLLAHQAKKNF